ncbi:hypothetical protein DV515_00008088 [Chloebia gouldiae]|uniref:Uncharacterized protein n=1 Tax=Chloebia gouldiae TaxID=44316 RepID=A0A3L8SG58_CHLGU|nr:hypothetical protein DV515_00008088 [Chloebia gouldiae]
MCDIRVTAEFIPQQAGMFGFTSYGVSYSNNNNSNRKCLKSGSKASALSGQTLSHGDLKRVGVSWKWALTSLLYSFTGKEEILGYSKNLHVSQLQKFGTTPNSAITKTNMLEMNEEVADERVT